MRRRPDWLAHGVLGLGVVLFAFPVWLIFAGATQDAGAINRGDLSLLPRLTHLGIFARVLREGASDSLPVPVWHMLMISAGMALAIAIGKIVISLLSAYAIVFFRFRFRMLAFWTIFVTLMLPVEVRIIPTYAVMADFHLVNSFAGLTVPLLASASSSGTVRKNCRKRKVAVAEAMSGSVSPT